MGLEDLTTLDATYPKGNIEPVSVLDNYQRETRAKLKAWAAVEHDLVTGHHAVNTVPSFPTAGRMYYDKVTGELRYYMPGPPGIAQWRSVIQPPFNYVFNPEFMLMTNGVASVPCGWTWSGAPGQTIQQHTYVSPGKYSIALTTPAGGSNANVLTQSMSTSNPRFLPIDYWRGRTISFGCRVACDLPGRAYIQLNDGVQYVNSIAQADPGGGWDWCVCTMTVSAGATDIGVTLVASEGSPAYITIFSEPTLVEGAWCTRPVPQGHPQRSHILTFNGFRDSAANMVGTNYYGPCGRSTNPYLASVIIPYRYCARDLAVYAIIPPGGSDTLDCNVFYNNTTPSSIQCQIAGGAVSAVDNAHTLQGDANSTLGLRVIGSGAASPSNIHASLYLDELPW